MCIRDSLEVVYAGGRGQVGELRILRMERQRDEGLEAAGLVLSLPQTDQMVDTLLGGLDVAVEHGRVGPDTTAVRKLVDLEPLLARDLLGAHLVAHAPGQHLGAATGEAPQADRL